MLRQEEFVEAGPPITDDRYAAGGGLEQADARRIAATDHIDTGHVKRETLPGKKHRMSAGSDVLDPVEIVWPHQAGRVERTRYGEAAFRPTARRRAHKLFEGRLPVGA